LGSVQGTATEVHFFHNESLKDEPGKAVFDKVGVRSPQGSVVLFAETSGYSGEPVPIRGGITGGTWFLLIVAVAFLAYFVFGVLLSFVFKREVEVPAAEFWSELWLSFVVALRFLFLCQRNVPPAPSAVSYENI
jgi:hypothetical protein